MEHHEERGANDHALLVKLLESQKKTARRQGIAALALIAIFVALTISLCLIVPRAVNVLDSANGTLNKVNELTEELKDTGELLKSADEALGHFNEVDFENLNKAIQDFANAVEPLSRLSSYFRTGNND